MGGAIRPTPLSSAVSQQMRRMPRAGTGPELVLRKELHRRGLRFRIHPPRMPGRPDIVMSGARLAIFVDGCFWHACREHGTLPKNNREWWQDKLRRNSERDREKDAALEAQGWAVIHIWEHTPTADAADTVESMWRTRTGRAHQMPPPAGVL